MHAKHSLDSCCAMSKPHLLKTRPGYAQPVVEPAWFATLSAKLEIGCHTSSGGACCCFSAGVQCDPVLMGGERLPVSLRQLNIDNCSSKGLASLLRLQSLQALSIRTNVCTVGAPDLAQLSRLPNLSSLQLGFTASAFSAGAALALTQFTALTHLSLGVPPEGSWVNARVSSKRTWPAAPVPFQCISRLTSLSSLSVWCINAAPQELAAAIAPLTALTRLLLHPESAWFFVEEEGHRRAARSAEDIAEDKRGIAVLVGVLAGLPKLRALKVNFWWRLTWDQEQQLERMLRRGYRMQYY